MENETNPGYYCAAETSNSAEAHDICARMNSAVGGVNSPPSPEQP